jgi:hypothetical protein
MSNPYRIQLLNDLHNHFPDLLYNHQQFQTTSDVLQYVINIARDTSNHVNPYPYYQEQFQSSLEHQPQYDRIAPLRQQLDNNRYNPISRPVQRIQRRRAHMNERGPDISLRYISVGDEFNIENVISSLFGEQVSQQLNDFLEDVPVIPTEEQISVSTTLKALDVDISDNCAVCQDQLKKEQETRTINHCSHMFHRECIDRWFETNVHCPCCRYDIRGL